uniref:CAZy families GH103 protein n=1 Tax=uncultured Rhodopseudomonas sp. TaxID=223187 RepID=A0A060C7J1_9BRAD|nr:CAZy families GH103 protein [uncultured Rhodopseudomonas sp.]
MTRSIAEWMQRGFVPAYGRQLNGGLFAAPASLLMPEGSYGPGFLTPANYFVIKEYNYSDLMCCSSAT